MNRRSVLSVSALLAASAALWLPAVSAGGGPGPNDWTVVGWNDLGMHCMDSDYEVFSILPPFNTIWAHVVDENGDLVDLPAGTTVTYQGVVDPSGSMNTTSSGKTNFWDHVQELFGANLSEDEGLAGNDMPGPANVPQLMHFDTGQKAFIAEGIPITPTDDANRHQNYPMMRLEVRDSGGTLRATTDIVLPVSSEMDCRACHASGAGPDARPLAGWENNSDYERDYRLNLLKLHDEQQATNPDYQAALANFGFNAAGLYETVKVDGRSVLCASCHSTNALPGTGFGNIAPMTQVMHAGHADAYDPITKMDLGASANRSSCYRCHPGSETRCLRGAMGSAVAVDGTLAMQCQNCHGNMETVGSSQRQGWFDEPSCQSCHSGTATHNNGQIRYLSVFEPNGTERVAVSDVFATNADTPARGLDLYRFSTGHGDLQCSACHGSTHAIYPSSHANDNLQSLALQGHAGTLTDCTACHTTMPHTETGGPHGMHDIGKHWVEHHHDAIENDNTSACAACHGTDYRGTALSRAQGERFLDAEDFGNQHFWEGYQIGCYDCHNGPLSGHQSPNHRPVVTDASVTTRAGIDLAIPLDVYDADGDPTTLRIVKQPRGGTVSLTGTQATYFPFTGFGGADSFTFAAADGRGESNLGTVTIEVTANWENFGEGHPGANGVPALSLGAPPVLGAGVPIHLGSSANQNALTILMSGRSSDYQPTPFGGRLLVREPSQRVFSLPPQGMNRVMHIPAGSQFVGFNYIFQTMVRDPAASHGFAFSRGLRMVFGH